MTTFVAVAFALWALMIFALLMTRLWFTLRLLTVLVAAFVLGLVIGTHSPTVAWVWFNGLGLFAVAVPLMAIWRDFQKMRRRGA